MNRNKINVIEYKKNLLMRIILNPFFIQSYFSIKKSHLPNNFSYEKDDTFYRVFLLYLVEDKFSISKIRKILKIFNKLSQPLLPFLK